MEMRKEISRSCKECDGLLVGRIDQCFCSDACRTSYHNRRKYEEKKTYSECIAIVQKTLLHNYKILTMLRQKGEQFSLLYLQDLGFSFRHLTSITEHDGNLYYHCFNESYMVTDQALILLND